MAEDVIFPEIETLCIINSCSSKLAMHVDDCFQFKHHNFGKIWPNQISPIFKINTIRMTISNVISFYLKWRCFVNKLLLDYTNKYLSRVKGLNSYIPTFLHKSFSEFSRDSRRNSTWKRKLRRRIIPAISFTGAAEGWFEQTGALAGKKRRGGLVGERVKALLRERWRAFRRGQRVAASRRLRDLRISRLVLAAFNRVPPGGRRYCSCSAAVSVGATPNESESSDSRRGESRPSAQTQSSAAPSPPSSTKPATQSETDAIPPSPRRLPFCVRCK